MRWVRYGDVPKASQSNSRTPRWLFFALAAQTAAIIALASNSFQLRLIPLNMSYQDWVAVLLTGVAVIISVLAVFLAVLAVIGWQTFDARVRQRTKECITEGFEFNGYLRVYLQEAVERTSYDMAGAGNAGGKDDDGDDEDTN